MEEKEEKDLEYTTAPSHRKTLSGTIIGSLTPTATTSAQAREEPTPPESGQMEQMALSDLSISAEQRVMILGHAASGKSTVGNAILGENLLPVPSTKPASDKDVTASFSKKTHNISGKSITVVDTQGLSDRGPVHDSGNFDLASAWLSACFPGPHVFVFVMNLFAYHQTIHGDADPAHRSAEKGERGDGGGAPGVNDKQNTRRQTAQRPLDSDVEQGRTENTASSRPAGERDRSRKPELLGIQKYFGDEALKYTVLAFTHGDKLNPVTLENMLKDDPHLKSLIGILGGNRHVDCSGGGGSRANAEKLMKVIDEMSLGNGGQHYVPTKGQKLVSIVKLLHLPFPVPPALATVYVSPAGIERLQKLLQKMAMGAVVGSIVGAMLGATLKIATFTLNQVGPSMIGYAALLLMPLILKGSSESGGALPLSSLTGGVISGFFVIMTVLGASMGCFRGGKAAADAQTFKEAVRMGAEAVFDSEKKKFTDSWRALVQRVSAGSEDSPSSETVAIQNGGPESGEPSENGTSNRNATAKDGTKQREEGTADSEQSSSSVSQQLSTSPSNSGTVNPETSASEKSEDQSENVDVNTTVKGIVETKETPQTFHQPPTSESVRGRRSTSPSDRDRTPQTSALEKSQERRENGKVNAITAAERMAGTKASLQTEEPGSVKTTSRGAVGKQRAVTLV